MKKIKKFWDDHKVAICVIGGSIALTAVSYLLLKDKRFLLDITGEKDIHWEPDNSFVSLERVKEILEANKDNLSQFAIFREGPNPAEYAVVTISNGVVIP